jgi:fumarylacetoacetase
MSISANNPALRSWVAIPENSDFPIQNLPFGIIQVGGGAARAASRIGDFAIDLKALFVLGYLGRLPFNAGDFDTDSLNSLMKKGKEGTRELREQLSSLFQVDSTELQGKQAHVDQILIPMDQVTMLMPVQIGDYTDFYSSREHATNVGTMFRDPNNALLPNWLWIPVGYHGRSSSIIISGQSFHRPKGQQKPVDTEDPIWGPCKQLDFELEMGFITYDGKPMGQSISTA